VFTDGGTGTGGCKVSGAIWFNRIEGGPAEIFYGRGSFIVMLYCI